MTQLIVDSFERVGKPPKSNNYLVRSFLADGKAELCSEKVSVKMVLSGKEIYRASGKHYSIKPGQFLLATPGESYEIEISSAATGCCLYFDANNLNQLLADVLSEDLAGSDSGAPEIFTLRLPMQGSALGQALAEAVASPQDPDFSKLAPLLAESIVRLNTLEAKLPFKKKNTRRELISRLEVARSYLIDMKFASISLSQLEKASCLSRYHLVRTFTLIYGVPPLRFHQNLKLDHSREKIASGIPVHIVADELGFASFSSFCRAFRRRHKCAPSDFRNK